jgi:glycosyltransferase involved in cell wall biosynthesis
VLRFIWPRLTSIWSCLKRANADIYYQRAGGALTGVTAAFCRRNERKSVFSAAIAGEPELRFRRDRLIYEYGIGRVDRIVVQNAEQQQYFRRRFGRESVIIPSLYDATSKTATTRNQVLWVSTIRERKRADLFLDLAEALPQYKFTLVGGPGGREQALFEKIRARAETLKNMDFVGFVPYAEVDLYFDRALVFVSTSNKEGFPNTFLHAWARGVPTVSFIDSGARDNGVPVGRLVNSIEEMTDVVAHLLKNDMERLRLGDQCKSYVENHHGRDRVLDGYEELFSGIVLDRRPN